MTLVEGAQRIAEQRRMERRGFEALVQAAHRLFENRPQGVAEADLIAELCEQYDVDSALAAAAVDRLRSGQEARKDWDTGFLSHA